MLTRYTFSSLYLVLVQLLSPFSSVFVNTVGSISAVLQKRAISSLSANVMVFHFRLLRLEPTPWWQDLRSLEPRTTLKVRYNCKFSLNYDSVRVHFIPYFRLTIHG